MTHAGLCCVGRPSATAGAEMLAKLLCEWPIERPIIIVAENDCKSDGTWPGQDGAEKVAQQLADRLKSNVSIAYPPNGWKDVRQWLTDPKRGTATWINRGAELSDILLASAVAIGSWDTSTLNHDFDLSPFPRGRFATAIA